MNRSDAADRLERLLRRDLDAAARESGPPSEDDIDAYISGRAGKVEREILEQHLADDPALKAEVDALVEMRRAIGERRDRHGESARRDQLDEGERFGERDQHDRPAPVKAARPADAGRLAEAAGAGDAGGAAVAPKRGAATRPTRSSPSRVTTLQPSSARRASRIGARSTRWETARRAAAMGALAAALVILALWMLSTRSAPPTETAGGVGGAGGASSAGGPAGVGNPADSAAGGNAAAGGGAGGAVAGGAGSAAGGGALAATLTLRDGNGDVSLLSNGTLRGLDAVPAIDRAEIARALTTGRLELSTQIAAVATPSGVLLSPDDASRGFRVTAPLATVVRSSRPTFSWTTHAEATGYRVRIEAADGADAVIESPVIPATASATAASWTPTTALPVGRVFTWQVEAQTRQGVVRAPVPPLPEARFVVLRDADRQALDRALDAARGSDLATAVALARFGVLDEADVALARLAAANPNAEAIARLRRQLSTRRFPR